MFGFGFRPVSLGGGILEIPVYNSDAEASSGEVYIIANLPPTAPVIVGVAGNVKVTITVITGSIDVEDENITTYNVYVNDELHAEGITIVEGASYDVTGLTNGVQVAITLKAKDSAGVLSVASNIVTTTPERLIRITSGLIFHKDFEDETLSPLYQVTGLAAIVDDSGSKVLKLTRSNNVPGRATAYCAQNDRAIQLKVKVLKSDPNIRIVYQDTGGVTATKGYYFIMEPNQVRLVNVGGENAGTMGTVVESAPFPQGEHLVHYELLGTSIKGYIDNILKIDTVDNSPISDIPYVDIQANVVQNGEYALFDNIIVMKKLAVVINNVPMGHKIKIGNQVILEVSGTCTIDGSLLKFPETTVELLDATDNLVDSFSPVGGIFGGDIYNAS